MSLNPVFHNLANNRTYEFHLVHGQSIAASKITGRAAWDDVISKVCTTVVDSIEATRRLYRLAIEAGLRNNLCYLRGRHVTRINALIGFSQKNRPSSVGFGVTLLPFKNLLALLFGKINPPIFSTVTPLLSCSVALLTFISQTKRSACILQEDVRRGWQFLIASVANSMHWLGGYTSYPAHNKRVNMFHTQKQDGPHWELPHASHPDPKP